MRRLQVVGTALMLGLLSGVGFAQSQDYRLVPAQELIDTPQRYWARPVVFVDRMVSPPGRRSVEFNRERYHEFTTERLGSVFAHQSIVEELTKVKPETPMLFLGTVQDRRSLMGRTSGYACVVSAFTTQIDPGENIEALVRRLANPRLVPKDPTLAAISLLVGGAQTGAFGYAAENQIDPRELFTPGSEHEAAALAIARNAVRGMEAQSNTSSSEVLARLVNLIVATRYLSDTSGSVYRASTHLPAPPPAEDPMLRELIDRSTGVVPVPAPAPDDPSEEDVRPPRKRRGFFGWLFGRPRPEAEANDPAVPNDEAIAPELPEAIRSETPDVIPVPSVAPDFPAAEIQDPLATDMADTDGSEAPRPVRPRRGFFGWLFGRPRPEPEATNLADPNDEPGRPAIPSEP